MTAVINVSVTIQCGCTLTLHIGNYELVNNSIFESGLMQMCLFYVKIK